MQSTMRAVVLLVQQCLPIRQFRREFTYQVQALIMWAHFTCNPLIASGLIIGAHDTDVGAGIQLLNGETLLQAKNSTGRRRDSNPGPCR